MLRKIAAVALGGSFGATMRYLTVLYIDRLLRGSFPGGTLAVNLAGSLVTGVLWGVFETVVVTPTARTFLLVGVLGGFTTFSAFSMETVNLLRDGEMLRAIASVTLNTAGSIVLAFIGYLAGRAVIMIS